MQITEKQKQQLIDLNDSRVNEILGFGLKFGEWYKKKSYGDLMFYFNGEFSKRGYNPNYGLNYNGIFSDEIGVFEHEVNKYYEATHQEVEQALIKEAKRRGFKKGVEIYRFWTWVNNVLIRNNNFELNAEKTLLLDGYEIFYNGRWAEIIDEKAELKEEIKELRNKLKSLEEKL